jgi:hypothetical protein
VRAVVVILLTLCGSRTEPAGDHVAQDHSIAAIGTKVGYGSGKCDKKLLTSRLGSHWRARIARNDYKGYPQNNRRQ